MIGGDTDKDRKQVPHFLWKLIQVGQELPLQKRKNTAIRHLASTQSWWAEESTMVHTGGYCVCSWRQRHGMEVRGFFKAGEILEKKQGEKEYFVMSYLLLCSLKSFAWNIGSCEMLTEAPTIFSPLWLYLLTLISTVVKIDSFQPSSSLLLQTVIVKVAGIAFLYLWVN